MPLTRSGNEYLNATESSESLEVSFVTFQRIQEEYNLKSRPWPGQGRQTWFLKWQVDLIKNDPDKAKELAARNWSEVAQ